MAQLSALNAFWTRHFADKGVFLAAYDEYRTPEEFAQRLEESLRKLIERRIKDVSAGELRTEPIWLGEPFRGLEPYEFEHAPIFFGPLNLAPRRSAVAHGYQYSEHQTFHNGQRTAGRSTFRALCLYAPVPKGSPTSPLRRRSPWQGGPALPGLC
jgi:hypothetical protein